MMAGGRGAGGPGAGGSGAAAGTGAAGTGGRARGIKRTGAGARRVVWTPQPKQAAFMARAEYEALYGGAAGGGKSDALLAEALRQVHIPHYRGIIFRKTVPMLSELVARSFEIYKAGFPAAKYNDNKHAWTFPSGAKIFFGYMQHVRDRVKYQGKRYDYVAFDELTHFGFDEYSYLFSRNRPGGPGTRCYIRSTSNPGGRGHGWVKQRFITNRRPGQRYITRYRIRDQVYEVDNVFIPATVYDNQILLANRPMYVASLAMMSQQDRDALLYGSWDTFEGQVFLEFRNDPDGYESRRWTHVVPAFRVPAGWRVYRSYDHGYARPFSVGWYAVDHDGRMYRIAELYGCTKQPNVGVRWPVGEIARRIKELEGEHVNLRGRRITGLADPAIFQEDGGESIAEMFERCGVYFDRADNKRIPGKAQMHNRLAFDINGVPMLYVFDCCPHFIRTIPELVHDETNPEDVDTDGEDHVYDECRYVLMSHPIAPRRSVERPLRMYNPLEDDDVAGLRRYAFMRKL